LTKGGDHDLEVSKDESGEIIWSGLPRRESIFKGWSNLEAATKMELGDEYRRIRD
jgi:hypothetical protein